MKIIRLINKHKLFSVLFLAGIILRVLALLTYRNGIFYQGDSYYYLKAAKTLSPVSFHPLGYSLMLRTLSIFGNLSIVPIVQHLMGLTAAFLIYKLLLRLGINNWIAALGAAPLLLDGYLINSESMIMPETLIEFLFILSLFILFWNKQPNKRHVILTGLFAAFAAITRSDGGIVILPLLIYVFLNARLYLKQSIKSSIKVTSILLTAFILPVLAYCLYHSLVDGNFTIDNKGPLFLYSRLSPLANCSLLNPKPDLKKLCDSTTPVNSRHGATWFLWSYNSPLQKTYNNLSYKVPEKPLLAFDIQILKEQWPTYLKSVIYETVRYFKPSRSPSYQDDPTSAMQFPTRADWSGNIYLAYDSFKPLTGAIESRITPQKLANEKIAKFLHAYQRFGYLPGLLLAIDLIVGLFAIIRIRNRTCFIGGVFIVLGMLVLTVSSAAASLNYRYLLPVEDILWAGGILSISQMKLFNTFKTIKYVRNAKDNTHFNSH